VLRIQNCNIFGFQTGVLFRPLAVAKLFIENTTISENDTGITIVPAPFGMSPTGRGGADVSVNKIRVQNNTAGILVDGGFGHIKMAMQDSEVSGNTKNGIHAKTTNHPVRVTADRIMSVNNDVGILSEGARARVTLNYSMITGNRANLAKISRGALESYKTNSIDDDTPGETGLLIVPIH